MTDSIKKGELKLSYGDSWHLKQQQDKLKVEKLLNKERQGI